MIAMWILACKCFTTQFSPVLHKYNITIGLLGVHVLYSLGFTFEFLVEDGYWNQIHGLLSFCSHHARGRLVFLFKRVFFFHGNIPLLRSFTTK